MECDVMFSSASTSGPGFLTNATAIVATGGGLISVVGRQRTLYFPTAGIRRARMRS